MSHMHPAQVVDFQADLLMRVRETAFQNLIRGQCEMDYLAGSHPDATNVEARARRFSSGVVGNIPYLLESAYAYYVAPDMTTLVENAAHGFDDSDTFRWDELPTPTGWAYFEKPLTVVDIRGRDLYVNGVIWGPTAVERPDGTRDSGTMLCCFNDTMLTPDSVADEINERAKAEGYFEEMRRKIGRWSLISTHLIMDGEIIGPAEINASVVKIEELDAAGIEKHDFTNFGRLMHAYWLMLGQTIVKVSEQELPRVYAKRARRARLPQRVTVVQLRRTENLDGGLGPEGNVEWSHRWLSRGHWRWQPVSEHHPLAEPDGSGGYRARLWVRESIKGPADKPLVINDKVYSLER